MDTFMQLNNERLERVQYDYADCPVYIRRAMLSVFPTFSAASHWHDDFEFIYVLFGKMDYNVNGQIVTIREGEGIFVNSMQMHYGFSRTREDCDYICVLFHPTVLGGSAVTRHDYVEPITSNGAMPYLLLSPEVEWQREILDNLSGMCSERNAPAAVLAVQSRVFRIWKNLCENAPHGSAIDNRARRDLDVLKEMVRFIQLHYAEKVTLDDIASVGRVCQSKCCSLFKRYLESTPNGYLIDYRVNKASELLRSSELSVTEISGMVGFGGASYFAETFRARMGCSPKEYRAEHVSKP